MGKEKVGRKPDHWGSENGRIPRGRLEGGWLGLELTDTFNVIDPTLVIHYCCSCFNISMKTVKFASLNSLYLSN